MNKELESFIKYCQQNPDERFWQAITNFSGYRFIFGSNYPVESLIGKEFIDYIDDLYYKE